MNRTVAPEVKPLKDINMFVPQTMSLNNGIKMTIINAEEQEVIRIDLVFKAGRWYQEQKLQALFTNRMMKEGTQTLSSLDISSKLDYYGAYLETSTSAEYSFITVYSLTKHFDKAMSVLESIIKESVFPEKELDTILTNNINQFRINSTNVSFISYRNFLNSIYGNNHPMGIITLEEDYIQLTSELLRVYYQSKYHSENCAIFLSGRVTDNEIATVEKHFGSKWGDCSKVVQDRHYNIETSADKRLFIEKEDALQSSIRLGYLTISTDSDDFLKLKVLVTLFGGYFGSRLMSNIREDKGYTYGISASLMDYTDSGLLTISTEADNKYVENVIEEVYKEIDILQKTKVTEEELIKVKNYMLGEFCRGYESAFSIADAHILLYANKLDKDYFQKGIEAINTITTDEIHQLANKYLSKENMKECIVGKKSI
ncbi:MAG: pitrilysin family protein [Bacteroides sp.]|nr:pitrilysin family protein [Bacteroides sp.]